MAKAKTPERIGRRKVLDAHGIAKLAQVSVGTVYVWRQRGLLPKEHTVIQGKRPVWLATDITKWLRKTNRRVNPDIELVDLEEQ